MNGASYSYDPNGNLLSGGGRAPVWDAENRITQIETTQFTYDAFGERIKKASPGGTSLYPFGDDYEVTGGQITKYVSIEGLGVIAKRVGAGPAAVTSWVHTDRLGSVHAITDDQGRPVFRRTYRPYGETLAESGTQAESRGWIDQHNDPETDLTYLHARYFDPQLGLFVSPDPLHPAAPGVGSNRYVYAFGDPVNGADRNGLDCVSGYYSFEGGPRTYYGSGECPSGGSLPFAWWDDPLQRGKQSRPRPLPPPLDQQRPTPEPDVVCPGDPGCPPAPIEVVVVVITPTTPPTNGSGQNNAEGSPTGQELDTLAQQAIEADCASFGNQSFGSRWWDSFSRTNSTLPGLLAPTGLGFVLGAGRTVADATGGVTLLEGVRVYVAGTPNATIASGNATWLARGAATSAATSLIVGGAAEIGFGIGSLIDAGVHSMTCR